MLDSLSVLLAAIAFIVFGYFSIVRLLYKLPLGTSWGSAFKQLFQNYQQNIQLLGYSTLLLALPAASLLLFWGWGPALLWLVIFHLFFETVINLRDATEPEQLNLRISLNSANINNAKANSHFLAKSPAMLWQLLIILLCSVLVTGLAQMIDQHSGLMWALLFLIPASAILNSPNKAIPITAKQIGCAAVFCFGLILADRLGVAVYGSWAPFGFRLDWFVLNNASITALGLVIAVKILSKNHHFSASLASLSGYLIISFLILLIVAVVTVRPELDAPLQSAAQRSESLPSIFSVFFILFGSALALILRLLLTHQHEPDKTPAGKFATRQSLALFQLIFCIILVLALAAAMGIGAWNTHYADWSWSADFLRHFELTQSTLFNLAANQSDVGSMVHTLFMAGASFVILSALLFCVNNLTLPEDTEPQATDLAGVIAQSKLVPITIVFLLSSYFLSRGVSLTIWSLIGMLAWFLLSHHLLFTANQPLKTNDKSLRLFQRIYSIFCLVLISIGWLQLVLLAVNWYQAQLPAFAAVSLLLLSFSVVLWLAPMKQLLPHFRTIKDPALFKK